MAIRQKARRPTLQILGRVYGPRIVGLHNRFRIRTDRIIRYIDLAKDPRLSRIPYAGVFVPGRDRHRIYLRPGAEEMTVAHELMHGILYTEGFVGLRAGRADLRRYPALGPLATRLGDLLVHPVLLERLRRARFPVAREEWLRAARVVLQVAGWSDLPSPPTTARRRAEACLERFSRAVLLAEAIQRHGALREAIDEVLPARERTTLELAEAIAARAPWDARRTGLRYRVAVGRLLGFLDAEAAREGLSLDLQDRILLPPFFTPGRLDQPARRFFQAEVRSPFPLQEEKAGLVLRFRLDGTAAAFRLYGSRSDAAAVRDYLRDQLARCTTAEFLARNRIDAVMIERGGRARIRIADPEAAPPEAPDLPGGSPPRS